MKRLKITVLVIILFQISAFCQLDENGNLLIKNKSIELKSFSSVKEKMNSTLPLQGFDSVRALIEINESNSAEAYPWISNDGLRLYFNKEGANICYTERISSNAPFSTPQKISINSSKYDNLSSWLTNNELEIYFFIREPNGKMTTTLYRAIRTSILDEFTNLRKIDLLGNISDYLSGPSITQDGEKLFVYNSTDNGTNILILNKTGNNEFTLSDKLKIPIGYEPGPGMLASSDLKYFLSLSDSEDHNMLYVFERNSITEDFTDIYFIDNNTINNPLYSNHQPTISSNGKCFVFTRSTADLWQSNDLYIADNESEYIINYELDGGINHAANPTHYNIESSTITLFPAIKEGYTFEGWFAEMEFSNEVSSIPLGSAGDTTLFAKWSPPIAYAITYQLDGGMNHAANPIQYNIESSTITLLPATKEGYTFEGWFAEIEFSNEVSSIPMGSVGDTTLFAKWEILYNLNFATTTDGSTPAKEVSININDSVYLISDEQGLASYYCSEGFTYDYSVSLDDIEIANGSGQIHSNDETIDVSIIDAYMRWNDILFCDNGKQLWSDFEWYKSGTLVSSEQFYHNEGGIQEDHYSLIVSSQTGKKFTWQQYYSDQTFSMSVYPNPLLKSGNIFISIKGLNDYHNCQLLFYNHSGQVIAKLIDVSSFNTFNHSLPAGLYKIVFLKDGKSITTQALIVL